MIFHRHKWTDWNVTDHGDMVSCGERVGTYLVQQRHCLTCGKTQVGEHATYGGHIAFWCHRVSRASHIAPRKDGVRAA